MAADKVVQQAQGTISHLAATRSQRIVQLLTVLGNTHLVLGIVTVIDILANLIQCLDSVFIDTCLRESTEVATGLFAQSILSVLCQLGSLLRSDAVLVNHGQGNELVC